MPLEFADKRAVVTGASHGIGRECAKLLASQGGRLVLLGRDMAGLEETASQCGGASIYQVDLLQADDVKRGVASLLAESPTVDVLVNCAGVWHDATRKFQGAEFHETPIEEFMQISGVGLVGNATLTRLILPSMVRRSSGKIVNISCGFAGAHEAVGWVHYYTINYAIRAFTRGLAAELRQHNVQVNCVAPWFVATEPVKQFYPVESERALPPMEVARMICFLASRAADHVSGETIELRSKLDV
jgi:3-oxoacyl-[acyl-carrier protein] reductase